MNRTPNDRSKWGSGPWDGEPDHVEWRVDGFPCMAHRNSRGAWCGYVAVPPGHWAYQMNYNRVDADVHGGLTYAGHCQGELCHVQAPGEPSNVWWLGFDTAHGCDAPPVMTSLGWYRKS